MSKRVCTGDTKEYTCGTRRYSRSNCDNYYYYYHYLEKKRNKEKNKKNCLRCIRRLRKCASEIVKVGRLEISASGSASEVRVCT